MNSDEENSTAVRNMGNDGLLFGAAAGLMLSITVLISIFTGRTWQGREAITFLSMAGIVTVVLACGSLTKFIQARRAGSKSFGLRDEIYTRLMRVGLLVISATTSALPIFFYRALGDFAEIVCWTMPLVIACLWLVKGYSNRPTPEKCCAYMLGASLLFLVYFHGLMGWYFLIFGRCPSLKIGERLFHDSRLVWMGGGLLASVCLFVSGASRYRALASQPGGALLKIAQFTLKTIAVIWGITCLAAVGFRISNYWVILALVAVLPIAIKVGDHLAHIRRARPVSRARSLCFVFPCLVLSLFFAEVMGLAGSCAEFISQKGDMRTSESRRDWVWYSPEFIRGPLAFQFASIHAQCSNWAYICSMVSLAELQRSALGSSMGRSRSAWVGLMERFPDSALSLARAVPPNTPGTLLANSSYDFSAGRAIGCLGIEEDVLNRLNGSYSREFVAGMLWGVPGDRSQQLAPHLAVYCHSQMAGTAEWGYFVFRFPIEAATVAQTVFNTPVPCNCVILDRALATGNFSELERRAFQSDDANLRKIAFRQWDNYSLWTTDSNFEIDANRFISAANGELPDTDDNERRLAAKALAERVSFKIGPGELGESPSRLSDQERLLIIKTIIAARDYCASVAVH